MRPLMALLMFVSMTAERTEALERELPDPCVWRFEAIEPLEIRDNDVIYDILISRTWPDGKVDSVSIESPLDSVPVCFGLRTTPGLVGMEFVLPALDPVDVINLMVVLSKHGTCNLDELPRPKPEHVFERAAQDLARGYEPNLSDWDFLSIRLMFETYLADQESRTFLQGFLTERVRNISNGKVVLVANAAAPSDQTLLFELVSGDIVRTLRVVPQRKPFWLEPAP